MLKYLFHFHLKEYLIAFRKYHLTLTVPCLYYQQKLLKVTLDRCSGRLLTAVFIALCQTLTMMKPAHRAPVDIVVEATEGCYILHYL